MFVPAKPTTDTATLKLKNKKNMRTPPCIYCTFLALDGISISKSNKLHERHI